VVYREAIHEGLVDTQAEAIHRFRQRAGGERILYVRGGLPVELGADTPATGESAMQFLRGAEQAAAYSGGLSPRPIRAPAQYAAAQ